MIEQNNLFSQTLESGFTVRRTIQMTLSAHGAPELDTGAWERVLAARSGQTSAPVLLRLIDEGCALASGAKISWRQLWSLPFCLAHLNGRRLDERELIACARALAPRGETRAAYLLADPAVLCGLTLLERCVEPAEAACRLLLAFHGALARVCEPDWLVADRVNVFLRAGRLERLLRGAHVLDPAPHAAQVLASVRRISARGCLMTERTARLGVYVLNEEWFPLLRERIPDRCRYERLAWTEADAGSDAELIPVFGSFARVPRALTVQARLQIGWALNQVESECGKFPERRRRLVKHFGSEAFGAVFVPLELLGGEVCAWLDLLDAAGSVVSRDVNLATGSHPVLVREPGSDGDGARRGVMFALRDDWSAPASERGIALEQAFRRALDEAEFRAENRAAGQACGVIPKELSAPVFSEARLAALFPQGVPEEFREALREPAAAFLARLIGRARLAELSPIAAAFAQTMAGTIDGCGLER